MIKDDDDMLTVTAGELQRRLGEVQDKALRQPVAITRHGREHLVLLSAEEFHRLKRRDRQVVPAAELSDAELEAIGKAEVPARFRALDVELGDT